MWAYNYLSFFMHMWFFPPKGNATNSNRIIFLKSLRMFSFPVLELGAYYPHRETALPISCLKSRVAIGEKQVSKTPHNLRMINI